MNKVIIKGRIARDPELKIYGDSTVTKTCVAVNRRFKREEADFINCTAFGKSAEFLEKHFTKGQEIDIVGRIQVSTYDDNEGNKRWSTDVIIEEMYFSGTKKESNQTVEGDIVGEVVDDEELPF